MEHKIGLEKMESGDIAGGVREKGRILAMDPLKLLPITTVNDTGVRPRGAFERFWGCSFPAFSRFIGTLLPTSRYLMLDYIKLI